MVAVALVALQIVATDTFATLVPRSLVPKTVRRELFTFGAGSGMWLALLGALAAATCAVGFTSSSLRRVPDALGVDRGGRPSATTVGAFLVISSTGMCIWA